jgi:2,5-dihydroxypyridine 5,6-dioxygenase
LVRSPIRAVIKNGTIAAVEGGEDADRLRTILERTGDPNAYNVAELGIGLNPKSQMSGIMLEDEGVFGTVHIGIGTSITLGGKVKAALHYDLIMWKPTLELDGKPILKDGSLLI